MTLSFDTATKRVSGLNVDTYLDDPKDVVTLAVKMASLPDGTNYVQQTVRPRFSIMRPQENSMVSQVDRRM